jgi:hypothetical protein
MKKQVYLLFMTFLFLQCLPKEEVKHTQEIGLGYENEDVRLNEENFDDMVIPENINLEGTGLILDYKNMAEELKFISSVKFNEESYLQYFDWRNNRAYINPFSYIDLTNMKIKKTYLPDEKYEYLRAPYSGGVAHVFYDDAYFIYDLNTKTIISTTNNLSHDFLFYDSDRRYTHHFVLTDEYTIAIESGWCYWLLTKDGRKYSEYNDENEFIINKINGEFKNTIFDEQYIMKLIEYVNRSFDGIITKEGISLATTWTGWNGEENWPRDGDALDERYKIEENAIKENKEYDVAVYFLFKLIKIFPDNNVVDELKIRTLNGAYGSVYQSLIIDIFDNGFYVYTYEKLIVMNIKNKTINYYNIKINSGDGRDSFKLSPDGTKCYFFRWRTNDFEMHGL